MLILPKLLANTLNALFPRTCVLCACRGSWLCPACWQRLARPLPFACPGCGRDAGDGGTCPRCHATLRYLRGAWSVGRYADEELRAVLHALKFEGVADVAQPLAALLLRVLERPPVRERLARRGTRWVLVPAPADPRRRRIRGLHPPQLLAERLATLSNLPLADVLRRRHRPPQTELTDDARRRNLIGAVTVADALAVSGCSAILVDDVLTTGATASACAAALVRAGVRSIWALTLARG